MERMKSLTIKNLLPGLVERGKIKIGIKGKWVKSRGPQGRDFQVPVKLDHFVVTTMLRDPETNNFIIDQEIMKKLGAEPTEIPIRLLYDDIALNFQTRYGCYMGNKLICLGDGEEGYQLKDDGSRQAIQCPCQRQDPKYAGKDKCKVNGALSVIIDGADVVGGAWKFRTTSYNSVINTLGSLTLVKRIAGCLAGLPLVMTLAPKTVANPIDQKLQTVYVIGIEFRGTVQRLRDTGLAYALADAKHNIAIKDIEGEARRLLSGGAAAFDEAGAEDLQDEFYPLAAKKPADKPGKDQLAETGPPVETEPPAESAEPAETPPLVDPGATPEKPAPAATVKRGRRKAAAGAQGKPIQPAATPQPDPPPAASQAQESPAAPADAPADDSKPLDLF